MSIFLNQHLYYLIFLSSCLWCVWSCNTSIINGNKFIEILHFFNMINMSLKGFRDEELLSQLKYSYIFNYLQHWRNIFSYVQITIRFRITRKFWRQCQIFNYTMLCYPSETIKLYLRFIIRLDFLWIIFTLYLPFTYSLLAKEK